MKVLGWIATLLAGCAQLGYADCFPKTAALDPFKLDWYCGQLQALGEGELRAGGEAYRFIYLRSFDPALSVRVHRVGDRWLMFGTVLTGPGGDQPGVVGRRVARELSRQEIDALRLHLDKADFWGDTWVTSHPGLDGAQWVLEGRRGSDYRLHDVWSPAGEGYRRYRELCLQFLGLAGLTPSEDRLY
jgi:hypothetical protein